MSSLYSWPGSRRCACRSTKPGRSQAPRPLDDADALAREQIGRGAAADARDDAALDDDVDLGVERARRIDGAHAAEDEGLGHGATRAYSTS